MQAAIEVGREGLETVDVTALQGNNLEDLHSGDGAKCGAMAAELAEVVRAWDTLPVEVRAAILAIVRGAGD